MSEARGNFLAGERGGHAFSPTSEGMASAPSPDAQGPRHDMATGSEPCNPSETVPSSGV